MNYYNEIIYHTYYHKIIGNGKIEYYLYLLLPLTIFGYILVNIYKSKTFKLFKLLNFLIGDPLIPSENIVKYNFIILSQYCFWWVVSIKLFCRTKIGCFDDQRNFLGNFQQDSVGFFRGGTWKCLCYFLFTMILILRFALILIKNCIMISKHYKWNSLDNE